MDRQTLRDWVHCFNQYGQEGLIDIKPPGRPSKLSEEQKEGLKQLVETGPDPPTDAVARLRCVAPQPVLGHPFAGERPQLLLELTLHNPPLSPTHSPPHPPLHHPKP